MEMKCGNPHGIPGCEWAEWKHHEKRIIEEWTGSPDDLELKLANEFDFWFPSVEPIFEKKVYWAEWGPEDFEEEPPCEVFE